MPGRTKRIRTIALKEPIEMVLTIEETVASSNIPPTTAVTETRIITYCVPCGEDVETYGKIPGICYSESIARNAIIEMFNSYGMLLCNIAF